MMLARCCGQTVPTEFLQCLGISPTDPKSARAAEMQRLFDEREQALKALGFVVKSGRNVSPTFNGGEPAK
jgi:hypothetical protein